MKQLNAEADVPNTAGDYSQWKKLPVTQNEYVHEIYKYVPLVVTWKVAVALLVVDFIFIIIKDLNIYLKHENVSLHYRVKYLQLFDSQ